MGSTYYVDPAAGGNDDGTDWTNAWTSIQTAFDTAAAGDVVYCRGTETVSASIDIDTNSGTNAGGYIKFIGCNASGNRDGTRFVVQGDGSNACDLLYKTGAINMIWLENIELKSAHSTGSGLSTNSNNGDGWVFVNCSFNSNAAYGVGNGRFIRGALYYKCTFYANTNHGYYSSGYSDAHFVFCSAHDNGGDGFVLSAVGALSLVGCLAYDNTGDGILTMATYISPLLFNCVINGNGDDGIVSNAHTNTNSMYVIGCRITNHSGSGDIGLNANSEPAIVGHCYFEDNDGDNIQNATLVEFLPNADGTTTNIEDQADTDEGYTSTTDGSEDFNLRSDASLRRTAITVPLV